MIDVAVMNHSSAIADEAIRAMLPAFEHQIGRDLRAVWGVDSMAFTFVPGERRPREGSWWVVFLDDSDQADALAYHDLTNEGSPISKVFVKSLLEDNASVSVGATHEICEMAVDPWLNSAYQKGSAGAFWAGEVCDPVEGDRYGYQLGEVLVTDFVTPNWFTHPHARGPIDFKDHAREAFEILPQGYAQRFEHGRGWIQFNGSETDGRHRTRAARGSRRERRARGADRWVRSAVTWS